MLETNDISSCVVHLMAEYIGPSNAEPGDNRRIIGASESGCRQTVRRASDGCRTAVEHVRVDHGRAGILVTEQLLDGADVVAVLEQMSREAVRAYDSLPASRCPPGGPHPSPRAAARIRAGEAGGAGGSGDRSRCGWPETTHCQAHSLPALGYLRAGTKGN